MLIPAARRVAATLAWVAIACWLAATVMSLLVVALFGSRPIDLHVRWADSTSDAERVSLERRFHLVDPERREGQTYSYTLIDVSRANIEALVGASAVSDTSNIDRSAFQPLPGVGRRPWATPHPWLPTALDAMTVLFASAGTAGFIGALLEFRQASSGRASSILQSYAALRQAAILLGAAVVLFAAIALTCVLVSMWNHEPYSDEGCHFGQVRLVWQQQGENADCLTTEPGYHVTVASLTRWFRLPPTLDTVRTISAIASAVMFGVFALCAIAIGSRPALKTAQLIALPILLLYTGLVYTDAMAMLGLLVGALFALRGRSLAAAVSLALTLLVRQTHIVWGALLVGMYWQAIGLWPASVAEWMDADAWTARFRKAWPFLVPLLLFAVLVIRNGGIAVGDEKAHHAGVYVGNPIFASVLLAIFFAPQAFAAAWRLRSSPWAWAAALICVVLVAFRFELTHPYNQVSENNFLRNRLLLWFASGVGPRVVLALAAVLGVWTMLGARVRLKALLCFSAALSLIPFELIEHRYAIPALAFFILLREPDEPWQEWTSLAIMTCLTVVFVGGVSARLFNL